MHLADQESDSAKQKSATSLRRSRSSPKYRIDVAQSEQSGEKMPQRKQHSKVKVKAVSPLTLVRCQKSQPWTSQKTIELVKQLVLLNIYSDTGILRACQKGTLRIPKFFRASLFFFFCFFFGIISSLG